MATIPGSTVSAIHVLLDCTAIPANRTGVGRYVEGLLRGLDPEQVKLTLLVQQRDREALARRVPWAAVHGVAPWIVARPLRFAWEQLRLPVIARRLGADVIHSPHYTFPLLWRRGRVVTVHDATFFSDPAAHSRIKRVFFRTWIRLAWARAGAVVTPSQATAGEVERYVGPPKAHVEVALLGVNTKTFHPPTPAQLHEFRTAIGLDPEVQWFAFLGTIEPRKNVLALLEAYRLLRAEHPEFAPRLLISGGRGWDRPANAALDALSTDSGVHELGYLPLKSLPALLGGSAAVLYPSLGEGFGLPVLEAMACEAAVVTTNRLAIPEVGGDAVMYAGTDARSIADAMFTMLTDHDHRSRMRSNAVARAATFTWSATAHRHVEAYRLSVNGR
jgi:glycosyltransferase involved in cell wall biosynthesis